MHACIGELTHVRGEKSVLAMQAQRAGVQAPDSVNLFPNIWEWKKPGYTNVCTDFLKSIPAADRAKVDFPRKAGYFEAGSAPLPGASLRRFAHDHARVAKLRWAGLHCWDEGVHGAEHCGGTVRRGPRGAAAIADDRST